MLLAGECSMQPMRLSLGIRGLSRPSWGHVLALAAFILLSGCSKAPKLL